MLCIKLFNLVKSCIPQPTNFKVKIGGLRVSEMVEISRGCDSAGVSMSYGGGGEGRGREGWNLPTTLG
jgi:hypothetical protein